MVAFNAFGVYSTRVCNYTC